VEADWESNAPELLVDKEGPEGVRAPKEWGPEGGLSPSPEGGGDQKTVSVEENYNTTQEVSSQPGGSLTTSPLQTLGFTLPTSSLPKALCFFFLPNPSATFGFLLPAPLEVLPKTWVSSTEKTPPLLTLLVRRID